MFDFVCFSCGNQVLNKTSKKKTLADFESEAREAGLLTWCAGEQLQIIKLTDTGEMLIHLNISSDFSRKLSVAGIDPSYMLHNVDVKDIKQVKELFEKNICIGNNDFQDVTEHKKGPEGQIPIRVSKNNTYSSTFKTIRDNQCLLFVSEGIQRCKHVQNHKAKRKYYTSQSKQSYNYYSTFINHPKSIFKSFAATK
ncbi:uncharacterized protein LOC117106387 [Anneissia japonica]|uniref:uncharacterized protein LOC117106387 n=1 Tax=Anneissia japonica TaxID=1529436 RepID=UPI001425825B|nr:uncharacterized protein LOC117106387 [Anneissia japonica]XP_033103738.1 uncharacterized protein LOC117106387 [Anneissia japonica]